MNRESGSVKLRCAVGLGTAGRGRHDPVVGRSRLVARLGLAGPPRMACSPTRLPPGSSPAAGCLQVGDRIFPESYLDRFT
jgi:hypothetical protein